MAAKSKSGALDTSAETYIKNLKRYVESKENSESPFSVLELEKFSLYHPVVIKGGEAFRAKRIVSLSNEILFSKNSQKPVRTYFASDLTNQTVINSLLAESKGGALFSKTSCVALYDTESLRVASIDKLISLLSLRQSEIFFLIIAGEKANKLLDALEGMFLNVTLSELQGDQLAKWSQKELERQGHTGGIEPAAVDLLVRSFGEDSTRLMTELSKLALLVSQGNLIKKREVQELLLQNEEQNTFSLLESIAEKKPAIALKIFHGLTDQGQHPLQILALLSKSVRSLLAASGQTKTKLHSDINNPWVLRNISKSKRLFTKRDLTQSLELVAKLDDQLKGSKRVPEELVEDFIVKLAGR